MKYVIVATAIRTLIALAATINTLIASAIRRNSSSPTYTLVMVNLRKKLRYGCSPTGEKEVKPVGELGRS